MKKVLLLVLFFVSVNLYARQIHWYQVEVIVYQQKSPLSQNEVNYPPFMVHAQSQSLQPDEHHAYFKPYQRLSANYLTLSADYERLKQENVPVLFYETWLQRLDDPQNPTPVHIFAGNILPTSLKKQIFGGFDTLHTFEGTITTMQANPVTITANLQYASHHKLRLLQTQNIYFNKVYYLNSPTLGMIIKVKPFI